MRFDAPVSVQWLSTFIDAEVFGDTTLKATGINEIHKVEVGDITFVDFEKYYQKSLDSPASIIIIDKKVEVPEGKVLLICRKPFEAYLKIVRKFRTFEPATKMISEDLILGQGTVIQPGVYIGANCRIGDGCIIHANVTIYDHTIIGNNVIVHSGSVLGADAFYYKGSKGEELRYQKMDSCGRVVVEDNVEIGALTTIDKGVSGDTIIGEGTKIDNKVHVGHGVVIGKNCLLAAQVGVGGKAIIEDGVTLWGQVGVNKDLVIGENAVVYAQSGVAASIEGGKKYFGSPVGEARVKMKELAIMKFLPNVIKRLGEDT